MDPYCPKLLTFDFKSDIISFTFPGETCSNPPTHEDVSCGSIDGFRYKCLECEDYDLCLSCEASFEHADHFMLRVPMHLTQSCNQYRVDDFLAPFRSGVTNQQNNSELEERFVKIQHKLSERQQKFAEIIQKFNGGQQPQTSAQSDRSNVSRSDTEDTNKCKVCWDTETNYCFVPCGHLICDSCGQHAEGEKRCPFCQQEVDRLQRIYIP